MRDMDLAAIVLADSGRRRAQAPEPLPLDTPIRGFDARSALVLALVVASMAGVIGWATTIGRPEPAAPAPKTPASDVESQVDAPAIHESATPATPITPKGIDLAPASIITTKSGNGGAIIRVGIANQGRTALDSHGAVVLVLLDGESVGEDTIGGIDATSSTTTEFALGYCPTGAHVIAVVLDPRGQVHEADERDNAQTKSVAFGC